MKKVHLKKLILRINDKMISSLKCLSMVKVFIIYSILFIVGRIISTGIDMNLSIIHQINLSIISMVELNILSKFYITVNDLLDEFWGRNFDMCSIIKELDKRIHSIVNIIMPCIFCIVFMWVIMFLGYLPANIMGFFGLFMATSSFFFALVAYYALVCSLSSFYELSKLAPDKLLNVHPNDIIEIPTWLRKIMNLYSSAKTAVFTVGLLYTIEYLLLVPSSSVEFSPELKINSDHPIIFLYNWIIIAVFVIIACPIIMSLFKRYLSKIIQNSKQNAVGYVDIIWAQDTQDINGLLSYQQIVNQLSALGMYRIPDKNMYPIITTSLAFILNVIKLFETYLFPFYGISV